MIEQQHQYQAGDRIATLPNRRTLKLRYGLVALIIERPNPQEKDESRVAQSN
jgi:hypothetical protein